MSGIEILGLVASASQLALYSIKITTCLAEICKRVQDAPVRIRQHSDQIRQLQSTVQLVQQNHLLQTAHVYAHINATLEQAKTLSAILEQLTKDYSRGSIRKYWKILKASREKEILDIFDRLEKEKSALILCISVIQMDQLGQGIVKMEMAEKEARQNSAVAEKGDKEGNQIYTDDIAPNEERTVPATSLRQGPNGVNLSLGQTQRGQDSFNDMAGQEDRDSSRPQGTFGQNHGPSNASSGTHHTYKKITLGKSGRQINADVGCEGTANHGPNYGPKHIYEEITAGDLSHQLNGNVGSIEALKAFLAPQNHEVVVAQFYSTA